MTRDQFKYLKERLSKLNRKKHDQTFTANRKPAEVVRAEKIIKTWGRKQGKIVSQRQARLSEAYAKAYQAIIFREAGDALKAMQEFERFNP